MTSDTNLVIVKCNILRFRGTRSEIKKIVSVKLIQDCTLNEPKTELPKEESKT